MRLNYLNRPQEGGYWEWALKFHRENPDQFPSARNAIAAMEKLRIILGKDSEKVGLRNHPLRSRLTIGYEPNYQWIIHFVRKLDSLAQIAGYEHVQARFADPESYASALEEMDFGLKLSLAGIPCRFAFRRGLVSPDIVATIEEEKTNIEITSLNKSYEENVAIDALHSISMIAIQSGCVSGGVWAKIPSTRELSKIQKSLVEKTKEAIQLHKVIVFNVPGLITCYIAPGELASELPKSYRGSFAMRTRSPLPKKDRLIRAINDKALSQLAGPGKGLLVIYDSFASPEEIQSLIEDRDVEIVISTFQNLLGIIFITPKTRFLTPLADTRLLRNERMDRDGRINLKLDLPDNESEFCLIWKNPTNSDPMVMETLVRSIQDFPANLLRIYVDNSPI